MKSPISILLMLLLGTSYMAFGEPETEDPVAAAERQQNADFDKALDEAIKDAEATPVPNKTEETKPALAQGKHTTAKKKKEQQ